MPSRHPRPTPPRFWWLKRVAPTVVLVGVAWAGFHLWLTRRVEAELAARVEQWRAEGDGPLPEQMNAARGLPPATVNGEPNAADLLTRAMTALPPLTRTQLDEWDNFEGPQMPIPADRLAVVRSIVAQDAAALPPARRAIDAPAVDWNQPPMGLFGIGNYNEMRALATHLKWSSSLAHHDGDLAASLTDARAILRLASAVPEYSPSLISGLIAAGCDAMAASQLRDAAWHRPPGLSPDQEAEAWRAARPAVEAAIRDLLDSNHDTTLIRRSWQGERASMALIAADPAAAAGAGTGTPAAARPFFTAGLLPLLDALSDAADAARTPVISAAPTDWQNRLAGGDSAAGTSFTLLTAILVPSLDRANQAFFKSIAERRAEAVVLAAKLFHAETGRWPASLDDLDADVPAARTRRPVRPAGHAAAAAHGRGGAGRLQRRRRPERRRRLDGVGRHGVAVAGGMAGIAGTPRLRLAAVPAAGGRAVPADVQRLVLAPRPRRGRGAGAAG